MRPPRPLPPVPRAAPAREPEPVYRQIDIEEAIAAHPATAAIEAVGDLASEIEDEVDDGLPYADHAVRAAPRDANGAFLPRPVVRPPLIVQIAKLGQALYGRTWMARVAADIGEYERKVRRWTNWEGRPPADALSKLKHVAELQIARIRSAINAVGGSPPTKVDVSSESADAPHVRPRDSVAEALALHIKERQAARVERPKAPRKGPPVKDP